MSATVRDAVVSAAERAAARSSETSTVSNWASDPVMRGLVMAKLRECDENHCVAVFYDERRSPKQGPVLGPLSQMESMIDEEQRRQNRGIPGVRYVLEFVDLPELDVDAELDAGVENPPVSTCHTTAVFRKNARGGIA